MTVVRATWIALVRIDDERILQLAGHRYRVAIGAFAELVVDHDKFTEFLIARQQNPDRPVQER